MLEIYTDGSCCGNGSDINEGGFGIAIFKNNQLIKYISEKESNTTNNRMELKALLYALDLANNKYKNDNVIIKSDSAYCVNIFNNWIYNWASNGWKNSKKQIIENQDLITQLYEFTKNDFPNYIVEKISGHSGILGNEIADAAATGDIKKLKKLLGEEYENFK